MLGLNTESQTVGRRHSNSTNTASSKEAGLEATATTNQAVQSLTW